MPSIPLIPTQFITLTTPRGWLLDGLLLGPRRPKTVFVFLHGLGGSLFSRHELTTFLPDRKTAVLLFNNRGFGLVNGLKRVDSKKKGYKYSHRLFGKAHEVFTDCVDDIDAAVKYVRGLGTKRVFLIGHSTGCQKSVYYLAKRPRAAIKGAILLAPISDYSGIKQAVSPKTYRRAVAYAHRLLKQGKKHELLPAAIWDRPLDVQRFLSLYTPESVEEIFGYASGRQPTLLKKVRLPLLIMFAEEDEYRDRPTAEMAAWFKQALAKPGNAKSKNAARQKAQINIIKGVGHNFSPRYQQISRIIKTWAGTVGQNSRIKYK